MKACLASPLLLLQAAFLTYLFLVTVLQLHSPLYLVHILTLGTLYAMCLWALMVAARADPGYLRQEHIEQIKLGIEYVKGKRV
jgi:hypothetical protein